MKSKKTYRKPELKSRSVQLGVFGDYGPNKSGGDHSSPVDVIDRYRLRME